VSTSSHTRPRSCTGRAHGWAPPVIAPRNGLDAKSGDAGGGGAVGHAAFREDGRDVVFDCLGRDEELVGDLRVAVPLGDQGDDLVLPSSEPEGVRLGGGARSGRYRSRAEPAQGATFQ
jgi:hypothetical protein